MDIYKKRTLKRIYIFDNYKFILKFEDGSVSNFIIDNFNIFINNHKNDLTSFLLKEQQQFYKKEINYISQVELFPKKIENFDYIYNGFKKSGKQVDFFTQNSFVFIFHAHTNNENFLVFLVFLKDDFYIIPVYNRKDHNTIEEIKQLKVYKDFLSLSQKSEKDNFLNLIQSLNHIDKSTILEFVF